MIVSEECRHCYGLGRIHSPMRSGDPFDVGLECQACDGSGVVDVDIEDDIEDDQ